LTGVARHTRVLLAVGLTAAALTMTAPRADAADESPDAFVARLRSALASGSRRAAAAMFRYPLRVHAPALPLPIPLDNAASTLRMYDLLFTPEMRCAIEMAQLPRTGKPLPKYPLVANGDALNLGQGLIVAERATSQFKITRMTLIGLPSGHQPGVPVVVAEIDLRFKGMIRQVAGNLAGDGFDRYIVPVTKGTVLQLRLERFKGLDAVLRVTNRTGQPVDARADGKRSWASVVPASADYHVEVVRKAPFCDPPITYLLTLTAG
jgi:hypothetical protein